MTLLHVQNLSIAFGKKNPVVKELSFTVAEGETLGIIGSSGAGKSSVALALLGLFPFDSAVKISGHAYFQNQDLLILTEREKRRFRGKEIAMIFQDSQASLNPLMTISAQITESLKLHTRGSRKALAQQALELLADVGIPDVAGKYPFELSGGQRQRVMIAIAIACRPKLLIIDEGTTALDMTTQAKILKLLKTLQQRDGITLLVITHDLAVAGTLCDRLLVMDDGRIVEEGKPEELFKAPKHPFTTQLIEYAHAFTRN